MRRIAAAAFVVFACAEAQKPAPAPVPQGRRLTIVGGGAKNVFWHVPRYAAVQFCPKDPNQPLGQVPRCDPLGGTQYAILRYDFGSLREPNLMAFARLRLAARNLPLLRE